MDSILELIKSIPDYIGGNGTCEKEIKSAEQCLGVRFAPDYRLYLERIGLACFGGHEITGICQNERLNVVDVTVAEREHYQEGEKWYVVEQANIDGIVIWQDTDGGIYVTSPNSKAKKIAGSLDEYIDGRAL